MTSVRRHSSNPKRRAGTPHQARDHSLRKLEKQLSGRERALVAEERSRNALGLAGAFTAHGERWRAVVAVWTSLPLGWKYPHWWYGAAKALAKAGLGPRRSAARGALDH